jgi:hypothetical protein
VLGGGAVTVVGINATAAINDALFTENHTLAGGAISLQQGATVQLTNSAFIGNSAQGAGSIYVDSNSDLKASDCKFSNDTASTGGSIILGIGTHSVIINCAFDNSSATAESGGAIGLVDATSATFTKVNHSYRYTVMYKQIKSRISSRSRTSMYQQTTKCTMVLTLMCPLLYALSTSVMCIVSHLL